LFGKSKKNNKYAQNAANNALKRVIAKNGRRGGVKKQRGEAICGAAQLPAPDILQNSTIRGVYNHGKQVQGKKRGI
jgi:hypothetical protein